MYMWEKQNIPVTQSWAVCFPVRFPSSLCAFGDPSVIDTGERAQSQGASSSLWRGDCYCTVKVHSLKQCFSKLEFGVRMASVWIPALLSTNFVTLGSCDFPKWKIETLWGSSGLMRQVQYLNAGHIDRAQKRLVPLLSISIVQGWLMRLTRRLGRTLLLLSSCFLSELFFGRERGR